MATAWRNAPGIQVRNWILGDYAVLGADGFGFSDSRSAAHRFFHIDGPSTAARVLERLELASEVPTGSLAEAIERYHLHDVHVGASGSTGGDA